MEDVKLTKEQSDIVDFIDVLLSDNSKYKAIGIKAFAGCGKSFVLKYIATKLKNKKILGLAFNNSIVKENAHSFPKRNSKWFTVHTLAKEYLIKNGVEFDFKNSTKNCYNPSFFYFLSTFAFIYANVYSSPLSASIFKRL